MRPLRGISDRAPLEAPAQGQEPARPAESCQPSGCVYPKRISGTPGTHRSYERALLYRMPNGVLHVIASTQHASLNQSDCNIGYVKSDLRAYEIRMVLYYQINSNPICTLYSIGGGKPPTQSNTFQSAEVLNRRRYTAQRNRDTQPIQILSATQSAAETAQHN